MKKLLFVCVLLSTALFASAQTRNLTYDIDREQHKRQKIREQIDLDYSVPDYNVSVPDEKVMGWRLAKILQSLEENYSQGLYNQYLTQIRNAQTETYSLSSIEKIKILNIQKQDSVITVKINTYVKENKNKINSDIVLTFTNSVSDDDIANYLFGDIARYIKKDEY
jgi:hypothetical protein